MQTLSTSRVDSGMKAAVKKLAERQFISFSAVVKQATERHLQAHCMDWRKEREKKPSK
jgi:hypothetical protein